VGTINGEPQREDIKWGSNINLRKLLKINKWIKIKIAKRLMKCGARDG
jgi:hypothetical protein